MFRGLPVPTYENATTLPGIQPQTLPYHIISNSLSVLITLLQWCNTLRQCATIQQIAGSIPDGVTKIFHWLNPSCRTIPLGSTMPLPEMSTRGLFLGGKGGRCVGLTTLPPSHADCLEILGASTFCSPKGLSRPIMGWLFNIRRFTVPHTAVQCTIYK